MCGLESEVEAVGVPRFDGYRVRDLRFGEFVCRLWATACDALAVPTEQAAETTVQLSKLLPPWAGEQIGDAPRQPSFVAADGFPAEMSVNWSGNSPELRVLFDCLSDVSSTQTILDVTSYRFGLVRDVFAEAQLWFSMAWRPPWPVVHKAYFGLYTWPSAQRFAALGMAMERLGMAAAWDDAQQRVDADGHRDRRDVEFLGLDLADTPESRVKIYFRNHGADLHEINRMASVALDHDADGALAAYQTLAGTRKDAGMEALTCLAFRPGRDRAAESTTYLRMPSLTSSDQETVDRATDLLRRQGADARRLHTLAEALAPGKLADSRGLLELVSHRAARRRGDITTYFRFPVYDLLIHAGHTCRPAESQEGAHP